MYATAQNTAYPMNHVSAAAEKIVRQSTAFDTVTRAADEVSRVENRLYNLMSRLVGDMPSEGASGGASLITSGLLPELELTGQSINRSVFRMEEMLAAIERALP